LALVTAYVAKQTRRSVDLAKQSVDSASVTAERQLRAYICFESGFIRLQQPNVPESHLIFRNSGQTPAYDVRAGGGGIGVAPYPWSNVLPASAIHPNAGIVGPRSTVESHSTMHPLTPAEVAMLASPLIAVWVFGRIEYRDTFGKQRFMNHRHFCRGPIGIGVHALTPDTDGNDAN
jgi:hypothetical protein